MPMSKKRRESWSDEEATAKKPKPSGRAGVDSEGACKDSDGNHYWELASKRRVVISEFKGQRMVSIREYYDKDGQALPGKKGISLPISQFSALVSLLPQIESVLREGGEDVPRPKYDEVKTADDRPVDEVSDRSHEGKKRNFEETSDEE